MKAISFTFLAALSIAALGCKKGGDCDKAIDHSMELSKADMKAPGMDDKIMHKLKDLGVQHCKDDKWPADVVSCMTDAKTETDSKGCYDKLSPEQQKKMNEAMMKVMMEAMPMPTAPTTTGSAPAGSATTENAPGSAAAGSAAGSDSK
jgi:hypothetical protein